METVKEKQSKMFDTLKEKFGYKNTFETPRLEKVVVSTGVGSVTDKEKMELIPDRLGKITGQKPASRGAKKSIASFKVRQGDTSGFMVTLRGNHMKSFVDKVINVVLPRTRDFKGISKSSVDEMGNLSIGLREHTVFPETSDEELRNVFGLSITLVSTAKNKEEATAFFESLGIPFKKVE